MSEIALQDVPIGESTIRLAAAGDEIACVGLVREHYAPMVRAAYVITGNAELAREATQVAWTKAWRRLDSLQAPEKVRSWLVAIAVNEARQLVRGQNRRRLREIAVGRRDRRDGDPSGSVELIDLKNAVRRLSPEDQGLLAMRFAAGLDANQIGEQSGMSASGVRSRLARLLDRLRKDLDNA